MFGFSITGSLGFHIILSLLSPILAFFSFLPYQQTELSFEMQSLMIMVFRLLPGIFLYIPITFICMCFLLVAVFLFWRSGRRFIHSLTNPRDDVRIKAPVVTGFTSILGALSIWILIIINYVFSWISNITWAYLAPVSGSREQYILTTVTQIILSPGSMVTLSLTIDIPIVIGLLLLASYLLTRTRNRQKLALRS